MSDQRGQASTLVIAGVILALVLSVLVGGGISIGGNTYDLNLNEVSNDDVSGVPDISFVAACLVDETLETDDIDIELTDTTATFESDVPIDYLIVKGGQRMELFTFSEPLAEGEVTFGTGVVIDLRQSSQPCDAGDYGVKVDAAGADTVYTPIENDGPVAF